MKILTKIIVLIALSISVSFFSAINAYADYTRVSESVNLRENPNTGSRVLKLVPQGYEIAVQSEKDGWSKVVFDGTNGFVKSEFIEIIKGASPTGTGTVNKQKTGVAAATASQAKAASEDMSDDPTPTSGPLRYGSEGAPVRDLQTTLTEKGFYSGPINGKFGPMTEEAVMKYQETYSLVIDGEVGTETAKKLAEKPRPAGTLRNGDESEEVKNLQKKLKEKSYYSGPVNGKFGPLTEEAVRRFQSANGIEVDGIVGKATLNLLNAATKAADQPAKSSASQSIESGGSGQSEAKTRKTAPNGVELIHWSEVKNIMRIGLTAQVYDVRSGITYNVKSFSNGKHADVEPVTAEDTELLRKAYGGVWSWDPRPVWVTVNGHTIVGSINGMPHGGGVNDSNGMNGQVCLHFQGSSTHNNNKSYAQLHQDAINEAWNAARGR